MWLLYLLILILVINTVSRIYNFFFTGGLGWAYRRKLGLSFLETDRLNSLTPLIKERLKTDFCLEEAAGLYIRVLRELSEEKRSNAKFNRALMRYCVYTLTHHYNFNPCSSPDKEVSSGILSQDDVALVEHQAGFIRMPGESEETKMYLMDSKRWKRVYDQAADTYDQNRPDLFYEKINQLASYIRNSKSSVARNIYYKGYLFMVDKDRELSLKLYLFYLSLKSNSVTFKHKTISKRNSVCLFVNKEQEKQFEVICKRLNGKADIDKALEDVTELFVVRRKKIELNREAIREADVKQNNVARLLGEYLDDEEISDNISTAERHVIAERKESDGSSREAFFELFASNSFRLEQQEVSLFAQSKGLFTDQFVESINDSYYDVLDDFLIEEEGEEFVLNEEYYNIIKSNSK